MALTIKEKEKKCFYWLKCWEENVEFQPWDGKTDSMISVFCRAVISLLSSLQESCLSNCVVSTSFHCAQVPRVRSQAFGEFDISNLTWRLTVLEIKWFADKEMGFTIWWGLVNSWVIGGNALGGMATCPTCWLNGLQVESSNLLIYCLDYSLVMFAIQDWLQCGCMHPGSWPT